MAASSASSTKSAPPESPPPPPPPPPPYWNPATVPAADSEEFLNLISYETAPHDRKFVPNDTLCFRWNDAPNPKTLASFGDNGVTASVNAAGGLIQLSSYIDAGVSSMFAANRAQTSEPYWVQNRAEEFFEYGKVYPREGFGLKLPTSFQEAKFDGYHCNRWPSYTFDDEVLNAEVRWMVHDGTVLQQMQLQNLTDKALDVPLQVLADIHICELEYLNPGHRFNEKGRLGILTQPNGGGFIVNNCMPPAQNTDNDAALDIVLLVSVFVDGKPLVPGSFSINDLTGEFTVAVPSFSHGPEVVVAYKLVAVPGDRPPFTLPWQDFVIPGEAANFNKHLEEAEKSYEFLNASELGKVTQQGGDIASASKMPIDLAGLPEDHEGQANYIDHIVRRNLEHILSVCSIPIQGSSGEELIALTCGDLAGHRITSSASFFAFSFLTEIAKRIQKSSDSNEKDSFEHLRSRIERVCWGHMRWLLETKKTATGCFSANYWVNGTIMNTDSPSFTPTDSHTDTAFQILKALDFRDNFLPEDPGEDSLYQQLLSDVAMNWVMMLHRADKRRVCAWSHAKVEGSDKYRLNNHFWIWKALKGIESSLGVLAQEKSYNLEDDTIEDIIKRLTSSNVQKEILRRFTTENDKPNKRMLAMTRSSRETRFLLHASDTALLYGQDQDFFLKDTPFNDLWQNTLETQPYHKENSESGWENLTRYALAVMMGTRNKRMNRRSPNDLVQSAMGVLFRALSPNCLFYGVIDATTKEPEVFQYEADKDFFFHASFEIPFILLTHCAKICEEGEGSTEAPPEIRPPSTLADQIDEQTQDAVKQTPPDRKRLSYTPADGQARVLEKTAGAKREPKLITMKKSQPFNTLFDQTSIVELNEEWLYNYPSFLMRDEAIEATSFSMMAKKMAESFAGNDDGVGSIIATAAKALPDQIPLEDDPLFLDTEDRSHWAGLVDVPKQKRGRKRGNLGIDFLNVHDLWLHLGRVRTARNAKKRILWMQRPSKKVALATYIATHEEERSALGIFFERYANFENYFFEDVTVALNEWDSELHLSFYQLEDRSRVREGYVRNKKNNPQAIAPEQHVPLLGKDPGMAIVRGSIGFRFYGDFFDRHWTCYLVEHIQDMTRESLSSPIGSGDDLVQQQSCWQQRKVLELHLFDRMIKEIVRSTEEILNTIRTELGVNRGSFLSPILNSDDYFTSSARWQKSQQILEIIDEELSNVITTIAKWDTRERDRGHERPRWTRNDERKYRLVIRKLEGTTKRRVRDLKKQHESLRLLKETLIRSQDRIRDDLSLRGAENIRFFTYVTVVFLPLGFAASIFSMSETPPVTNILRGMVVCAFVALFVTIMMLANAKKLNSGLRRLRNVVVVLFLPLTTAVSSFSSQSRRNSPLSYVGETNQDNQRDIKDEEASVHTATTKRTTAPQAQRQKIGDEKPGAWRFWLTYAFLEFPARKVLRAYYTARKPDFGRFSTYKSFVWGVILLPLLVLTYPLHISLLNVADLARICWRFLTNKMQFPDDDFQEDDEFKARLNRWVQPSQKYRPLKDGQLPPSKPDPNIERQDTADEKAVETTKESVSNGS